jgi:transcriptional regulator with XRE-family HTH domain
LRRLLSANIKAARKRLNISQEQLAELSDMSPQTINGIEGCRIWVSDKTMIKLSNALKIQVFELLMPENINFDTANPLLTIQSLKNLWETVKSDIDSHFQKMDKQL